MAAFCGRNGIKVSALEYWLKSRTFWKPWNTTGTGVRGSSPS